MGDRSTSGPKRQRVRLTVDVQRHAPQWRELAGAAALVRCAAKAAIAGAGATLLPDVELSVALADDAMVRDANRDWRQKDQPTNVLSFPSVPPERLATAPYLGDIILAYETVAREATAEDKPLSDHVTHLVIHGVLHLLGYDHMTKVDAALMEGHETLILAKLGVPDPYAGSEPAET